MWSEASVRIQPDEQQSVLQRLAEEARRLGIVLVATFGVEQGPPDHYIHNKFVLFEPDGGIALDYSKHVPVPTERALRGEGPIESAETPLGRIGGAICYDYDSPWIGRALARADTGIAVVPSADLAGINPLHTKMARFRAIEGGYSLIRATNRGPSAAFDAYGRIQAWLPFSDAHDRLMMATLPNAMPATRISNADAHCDPDSETDFDGRVQCHPGVRGLTAILCDAVYLVMRGQPQPAFRRWLGAEWIEREQERSGQGCL